MRFKNYINSYTKRNRILSDEDMLNMTLGKMLDDEEAILAQHNTIGFPKLEELQSSPNTQWVEPFVNNQGKQDGGYWQSVLEPMYQESYIPRQPKVDYYHGINGLIPVERTKEGILDDSNYYQEDGQFESPAENQKDENITIQDNYSQQNSDDILTGAAMQLNDAKKQQDENKEKIIQKRMF